MGPMLPGQGLWPVFTPAPCRANFCRWLDAATTKSGCREYSLGPGGYSLAEVPILLESGSARCGNGTNHTCSAGCVEEVSCRMFLCVRCRSQSLICRRCDRGQIYCMGSCARDARREGQRDARRRHQATPRGRAMHAERNRRYRARMRRVTDHGLAREDEAGHWGGSGAVPAGLSEPSPGGRSPGHGRCHHCGRPASTFLRLASLRSGGRRGEKTQMRHRDPRPNRPP
jgi:hypothetical protein